MHAGSSMVESSSAPCVHASFYPILCLTVPRDYGRASCSLGCTSCKYLKRRITPVCHQRMLLRARHNKHGYREGEKEEQNNSLGHTPQIVCPHERVHSFAHMACAFTVSDPLHCELSLRRGTRKIGGILEGPVCQPFTAVI